MRRGDLWWADLPKPAGRRPVVLLSRNEAYHVRELVTITPVTSRVRDIPTEVALGHDHSKTRAVRTHRLAQPPKTSGDRSSAPLRARTCWIN